jgi:asparagine synthase (glutamine-hydrolysing)
MCGITGILSLNGKPLVSSELEAMNTAVAHRGPDGEGYWIHQKGSIGFGHRRLSILDLSDRGKQPMCYADGRFHITYNGEVFNFIELRTELETKGYSFRSDTDTEVILAAYDYWGKDCLHQFNGMWAFAIWDEREQELFLARDHFGIKPLYYLYQPGKRFVFGSETIQFKYLEGYRREFDEGRLLACIKDPYSQEGAGLTIYAGIKSILPGHYMVVKNEIVHEQRWWGTMDYHLEVPESYPEQVERFRELFFDSCKLRMRSDVPIASALSGGIDSSSVYSSIYHLLRPASGHQIERLPSEWQKAFVAIFPGTVQDETQYARDAVAHVQGKAVYWEQSEEDLINDIIQYTRRFDAVYSTPIHVIAKVYEGMRPHGIVVSMDGHGVDEMMYGYAGLQLDAARHAISTGNDTYAQDLIDIYVDLFPKSDRGRMRAKAELRVFGNELVSARSHYISRWKRLGEHIKRNLIPLKGWLAEVPVQQQVINWADEFTFEAPCEKGLFGQFHYAPLPAILRNFDKASMMSGVEIRMPFMDHRLVAYVFKLPLGSKLGNGFTKRILRDAMAGILPESIRLRTTKIGFNAPTESWFEGPLKHYLFDMVHTQSFREATYWRGKIIARDIEAHFQKGKPINFNMLWNIMNTYILAEQNKND